MVMQARCFERDHIKFTVDNGRASLSFSRQLVSIDELEGEIDPIVAQKGDRFDRPDLERPGVLVGPVRPLEQLRYLDQQGRLRKFRKRIPFLAAFLNQWLAGLDPTVECDIIELLTVECPNFSVLAWAAVQSVPVPNDDAVACAE